MNVYQILIDALDEFENTHGLYSLTSYLSENGYVALTDEKREKLSEQIEEYLSGQKDIDAPWIVEDLVKLVEKELTNTTTIV